MLSHSGKAFNHMSTQITKENTFSGIFLVYRFNLPRLASSAAMIGSASVPAVCGASRVAQAPDGNEAKMYLAESGFRLQTASDNVRLTP